MQTKYDFFDILEAYLSNSLDLECDNYQAKFINQSNYAYGLG